MTSAIHDLRCDRFELDVLVTDSTCLDCRAPLPKYSVCVMRQPHGKRYAFATCRDCAEKRIAAMVVVVRETCEHAPTTRDTASKVIGS